MDKYEISLWEDFSNTSNNIDERKLCVIGSNTMQGLARALEPRLITNINGTHTFTFKMYQVFTDEFTGEQYTNPFLNLLINERKVKVFWKDQWYDFLIKGIDEDTSTKSVIYTCKDSFITELSRNGYNLEYNLELQNSTGTAEELVTSVLENSGWQYDKQQSTKIYQRTEEPVYEIDILNNFSAIKQSPNGDTTVTIKKPAKILVFYSSIVDITESGTREIQFLYANDGYETEENNMLVLNGNCYVATFNVTKGSTSVTCVQNNKQVMVINTNNGVSLDYRAEKLVNSQLTAYDELFNRYVNVYTDKENNNKLVYGYSKIEFTDPTLIVNLIANSSSFSSLDGWIGKNLTWGIYPKFNSSTDISKYNAISYLKVPKGTHYNSGITSNLQYLVPSSGDIKNGNTGGFHKGDQYIFRVKFHVDNKGVPDISSYEHNNNIQLSIQEFDASSYEPTKNSTNYFTSSARINNEDWNEYTLTCNKSCPADKINTLGLFISATDVEWIEDIEFFRYQLGIATYDSNVEKRINPGEIDLQSISKTIYRYYNADHNGVDNVDKLVFLYEGETEQSDRFIPKTNNYEKIATIEIKNSNRFNILQAIAERFKCWVRFRIEHDETGKVTLNSKGLPNKYVTLVENIGTDLGWSFEYGIDVRNIKRTIVSDSLTTKVLVLPNDNEFGKNGFCTIARSNMNYAKENFVLDFGYYLSQGLLNETILNSDLYSTSTSYIGYYYRLHNYNKKYDNITEILVQKQAELLKQSSQLKVLQSQQKASQNKLGQCKSDLMTLASVTEWSKAQQYAQSHADHVRVQSLMNNIASLTNTITKNSRQINNLIDSVTKLQNYIDQNTATQKTLIGNIEILHNKFFQKYARFIQEGTWQDNSYIDDDKYYLDAVDVAYTSSRPQLQYDINVMRLTSLEDFSSKKFDVGDICYVVDRDFFGYSADGITPYKLKIIISEITSFFDNPEKDTIKVQNYKTQFDDLFQRITATTQSLQYASGGYEKAAGMVKPDRTIDFSFLQETFDLNKDLILSASNQNVVWDSTGLTVTDNSNSANQVKLMSGGLFISNDGGNTWKNAVRGDGITADVLTAGRINTGEIYIYDGQYPAFRWDSAGLDAYYTSNGGVPNFGQFVRFDRFGIYGYKGAENSDFIPTTENQIWNNNLVKFGLTWKGFFLRGESGSQSLKISDDGTGITFSLKGSNSTNSLTIESNSTGITFSLTGSAGNNSLTIKSDKDGTEFKMLNVTGDNSIEISTAKDIILKTGTVDRIQIGRLDPTKSDTEYGIWVRDGNGDNIFNVSSSGTNSIGGWNLTKDSFYHTSGTNTIGLYSSGKSATVQGNTTNYYILAGTKFGVTIDGNIYSSGGKIGGWTIGTNSLTGGNVIINSDGTISCTINNDLKWKLDKSGDIFAKNGEIAGWKFTTNGLYNTHNGTYINSGWDASYNVNKYTIQTDSLSASGGSIGGCTLSSSGISGGNWSLSSSGGSIGGWSINRNSISSGGISLNSEGSISFGGGNATITYWGSGGIEIQPGLHVTGAIGASLNIVSASFLMGTDLRLAASQEDIEILATADIRGLHKWKKSDGTYYSPNEVRVDGINSVAGWGTSKDGDWYNWSPGGGVTLKRQDITINAHGTDLDGKSIYISGSSYIDVSSIYNDGKDAGEAKFSSHSTTISHYKYDHSTGGVSYYTFDYNETFNYYTKDS